MQFQCLEEGLVQVHAGVSVRGEALEAGVHEAHELQAGEGLTGEAAQGVLLVRAGVVDAALSDAGDLEGDLTHLLDGQLVIAPQSTEQVPDGGGVLEPQEFVVADALGKRLRACRMVAGVGPPFIPVANAEQVGELIN